MLHPGIRRSLLMLGIKPPVVFHVAWKALPPDARYGVALRLRIKYRAYFAGFRGVVGQ